WYATKKEHQMTFTERTFRDALGLFPTGVAVVTTVTKDGTRIGATISSFNSVSLSPPLVLFSIARTSRSCSLDRRQYLCSQFVARTSARNFDALCPLSRGKMGRHRSPCGGDRCAAHSGRDCLI